MNIAKGRDGVEWGHHPLRFKHTLTRFEEMIADPVADERTQPKGPAKKPANPKPPAHRNKPNPFAGH